MGNIPEFDHELHIPDIKQLEHYASAGAHSHIIVLQIQEMSNINLTHSHDVGVTLLRMICSFIKEMDVDGCALYRMGSDTLALLIDETSGASPEDLSEAIHTMFDSGWLISSDHGQIVIRTDVNICLMAIDKTFDYLQRAVSYGLEVSGSTGKVAVLGHELLKRLDYRINMENELCKAVSDGMTGFCVEYQPIIETRTGIWSGLEALCRWNDPKLGVVYPSEFIVAAEACGLIKDIGRWVLEQSISHAKSWKLDQLNRFMLFVNVSRFQLLSADIADEVYDLLKKYDYPPEKLCFEISYSDLNFPKINTSVVERISSLGVVTALDDFGMDNLSIDTLNSLPVLLMKMHSSFTSSIESDSHAQHLLHYIVSLAHEPGKKTVAKGVETKEQLTLLLNQGIDYVQGRYFANAMPPGEIKDELYNFYLPTEKLRSVLYSRSGLPKYSYGLTGYELNPSNGMLLNKCMLELFYNPEWDRAISGALEMIGNGMHVNRAYVFLKDERKNTFSNTHEWCSYGVIPEKSNLQHVPLYEFYPTWINLLTHDGFIIASDISFLLPEIIDVLNRQNTKAIAVFSIFINGELRGFVGFDHCDGARIWSHGEIQMLHLFTDVITSAIVRMTQEKKLMLSASTDTLTNTLNRSALLNTLKYLLKKANEDDTTITIAFIDIDYLKKVNSTYGHISGDELIVTIASALYNSIRDCDVMGRYGGDEFVIAFNGRKKGYVDDWLRVFLENLCKLPKRPWTPSFTYGLVENTELPYTKSDEYLKSLIAVADKRMLTQKRERGSRNYGNYVKSP